jgi:hypothetical protein
MTDRELRVALHRVSADLVRLVREFREGRDDSDPTPANTSFVSQNTTAS